MSKELSYELLVAISDANKLLAPFGVRISRSEVEGGASEVELLPFHYRVLGGIAPYGIKNKTRQFREAAQRTENDVERFFCDCLSSFGRYLNRQGWGHHIALGPAVASFPAVIFHGECEGSPAPWRWEIPVCKKLRAEADELLEDIFDAFDVAFRALGFAVLVDRVLSRRHISLIEPVQNPVPVSDVGIGEGGGNVPASFALYLIPDPKVIAQKNDGTTAGGTGELVSLDSHAASKSESNSESQVFRNDAVRAAVEKAISDINVALSPVGLRADRAAIEKFFGVGKNP